LLDTESVRLSIEKLRTMTDLPIVIGFGIKDAASARAMGALSEGVIIGSALVERIEKLPSDDTASAQQLAQVTEVIKTAREALDTL
jgi:tryptophan synthase alpha chain